MRTNHNSFHACCWRAATALVFVVCPSAYDSQGQVYQCPGGTAVVKYKVATATGKKCGFDAFTDAALPRIKKYAKQTTDSAIFSSEDESVTSQVDDLVFVNGDQVLVVGAGTYYKRVYLSDTNSHSEAISKTDCLYTESWSGYRTNYYEHVEGRLLKDEDSTWNGCNPVIFGLSSELRTESMSSQQVLTNGSLGWYLVGDMSEESDGGVTISQCVTVTNTPTSRTIANMWPMASSPQDFLVSESETRRVYSFENPTPLMSGDKTIALDEEYTDTELYYNIYSKIPDSAFPSEWTSPGDFWGEIAYSVIDASHVDSPSWNAWSNDAQLQRMRFRIELPTTPLPGEGYQVRWDVITWYMSTGRVVSQSGGAVIQDPANPYVEGMVEPPWWDESNYGGYVISWISNIRVDPIGNGSVQPGTGLHLGGGQTGCTGCGSDTSKLQDLASHGVLAELSLGSSVGGLSAGMLTLSSALPHERLATPSALSVTAPQPTQRIYTSNILRQIKASQTIVDLVPQSSYSFELRFYLPSEFTSQTNGAGLYEPLGNPSPFVTWRIENPDASTNLFNRVRVTETRGSQTREYNWTYSAADHGWSVQYPGSIIQLSSTMTVQTNTAGGYLRTVTQTTRDSSGGVVFKKRLVYEQEGNAGYPPVRGELLIQETIDPDGDPQTTTYSYYPYMPVRGTLKPVKLMVRPNASWEFYQYDSHGRITAIYAGTGDVPPYQGSQTPDVTQARQTSYIYSPFAPGDDGLTDFYSPRQTWVNLNNRWESLRMMARLPDARREAQLASQYLSFEQGIITTTTYYTNGPSAGRVKSIETPEGSMELYVYETATNAFTTNTVWRGQPNAGKSAIINGQKSVTIRGPFGQMISSVTSDIATGAVLSQDIYGDFDDFVRPTRVTHLDGTFELTQHSCCGIDSTTDRDGVVTTYGYDEAGRRTSTTRNGITTLDILSASGQVLQTVRSAPNVPQVTLARRGYDLAGRLTAETNGLSGVTTFAEVRDSQTGGLIQTTTYPDGGTRIETYNRDGTLKTLTGSSVLPVRYANGYDWDFGMQYSEEIKLGATGADTTEWTRTYRDLAGRSIITMYSDDTPYTTDNPREFYYYNSRGQLWKQVDPDGITTLTVYGPQGEQAYSIEAITTTARDISSYESLLSQLNSLKGGLDRITWTTNDMVLSHGVYVRRTRTYVWNQNNSSTPALVSMSEVSTNGSSWSTTYSDGGLALVSQSQSANGSGTRTVTSIAPDNSYTISLYATGRLASVTRYNSGGTPIGSTTYSYDPHGRQQAVTDARNGSTTYTYNAADLIETVTSPAPGTTSGGPQVTRTYYNKMLQATNTVHPDASSTFTDFYLTGELKKTWGSRSYPVEYTYDFAGRMKTMKTWQSFASASGAAITTWNYHPQRGWLLNKRYQDNSGPDYTYTPGGRLKTRSWARTGTGSQRILATYTYGFDDAAQDNEHGELVSVAYSNDPLNTPGVAYTYDRLGRQTAATQGSTTTTFLRGLAGQLLSESYSGGPLSGLRITNRYDQYLRRTNVATLNASLSTLNSAGYSYDTASRLQTVASGDISATYSYLANSPLVEQVSFKQGANTRMTTTKSYDRLNRLTQIQTLNSQLSALNSFNYSYNSANQRTRATLADGSYWLYEYDRLGQVISGKKYWSDGTPVAGQQFEYGFDDIGNRTGTKAGGDENGLNLRTATYGANLLNQYTNRTVPGAVDIMGVSFATNTVTVNGQTAYRKGEYFRKDLPIGNTSGPAWTNITVAATGQSSVTGSMLVAKASEAFWHDADGNLLSDSLWTNRWNAENRLVHVESTTAIPANKRMREAWSHLPDGRWLERIVFTNNGSAYYSAFTNRFVWDGQVLMAILNHTNGLVMSFVRGLDLSGSIQGAGGVGGVLAVNFAPSTLIPQPSTHFLSYDGNGNVVALASTDGTVSGQFEYGPFSEPIRVTGTAAQQMPLRFSTMYEDSVTGDRKYLFRDLNPTTGRWKSRDPIEENGGANLLGFVENNGILFYDPLGHSLSDRYYSLSEMQAMLVKSVAKFRLDLYRLCPCDIYEWVSQNGGYQICTLTSCRSQADMLASDFARYLKRSFTSQYRRFGNVIAFFELPTWVPWIETINMRAHGAPNNGMIADDYDKGYGLKCAGMQSLIMWRFLEVELPNRVGKFQCFKGARVGNGDSKDTATHNWYAIYPGYENDIKNIGVVVDPWFSAGGVITPEGSDEHRFGQERYFYPDLW